MLRTLSFSLLFAALPLAGCSQSNSSSSPSSQSATQPAKSEDKIHIIESPIAENCYSSRPEGTVIDTVVIHHASAIYWFDPSFQDIVGEDGKTYAETISLNAENLDEHKYDWLLVKPIFEAYRVSAHYAIARNGEIVRIVQDKDRAWHAGRGKMPVPGDDREGLNDFSIGIELMSSHPDLDPDVVTPEDAYTEAQYEALNALMKDICSRSPITAVVGHDEIAPGRKTDPGPLFDWSKIRNDDYTPVACE